MFLKLSDFRSRFGRKVLLLIFLVAFGPLTLLAYGSYQYVGNYLYQQSQQELEDEARFYSMLIYERLQGLGNEFSAAVALRDWPDSAPRRYLEAGSVELSRWQERVAGLGPGRQARLMQRLTNGQLLILSQPDGRLLLLQKAKSVPADLVASESDTGPWLRFAVVSTEEVIGQADALNSGMNYCVFGSFNERLFCSRDYRVDQGVFEALVAENGMRPSFIAEWDFGGAHHLVQVRSVFISNQFGAPSWKVWVSEPTRAIYAALAVLQKFMMIIALLAAVLAFIAGAWQIRRILQPVRQFEAATQAIADGNFEFKLNVGSRDELQELANAFNQMAAQIGKQFHLLSGLSSIDQLILNIPDLEQVAQSSLRTLRQLVPAEWTLIALRNPDTPEQIWLFRQTPGGEVSMYEQHQLSVDEQRWLSAISPSHRLSVEDKQYISWLSSGSLHGKPNADPSGYAFPISANGKNRGLLGLGWQDPEVALSVRDQSLLQHFTDRLAVAISAVRKEKKLYQQAHFDHLTNLPNRQLLKDRLHQALKHVLRNQSAGAVLFVDLDNFKKVNDTEGHAFGDQILVRTAERLQVCVTGEDTVARQGSDEFIIVINDVDTPMRATRVANKVLTMLSAPYNIDGSRFYLNCSVGIAVFPSDGMDVDTILRKADTALHRVKAEGGGHYRYFEEEMNRASQRRVEAERQIRDALDESKIQLHYQPQWYASEHGFCVEALVRLHDRELGLMGPGEFIGVAEDTGLIIDVGEWVINEACRQMALWREEAVPVIRVSVNVSAHQLSRTDFVGLVQRAVAENGVAYTDLELEVTESVFIDDSDRVIVKLEELRALGVRIAIDDFGTGYSSLSYLHNMPFDLVKIDQSFVSDIGNNANSGEITRAIITLAKSLQKQVMAEGVENAEDLKLIHAMGCDAIQGYVVSRPLSGDNVRDFIQNFDETSLL